MNHRTSLAVLVLGLALGSTVHAETRPDPVEHAAPTSYFATLTAMDEGHKSWEFGTALIPGERANLTAGKMLCVKLPGGKAPGVQEITVGHQWSIMLRFVKDGAYRAEFTWADDAPLNRTEEWLDRTELNHTTTVVGTLGKPQRVALLSPQGSGGLVLELRVDPNN